MLMLAAAFRTIIFEYSYQALLLILIMSAPPIIFASLVGLFVAIIQAATQIQEQTFAFAVKLVVVMGSILVLGGWIGGLIYRFAHQIFHNFYKWTS